MYTSLANFYSVQTKLFIGQPRMSLLRSSHSPGFLMNDPVDELVGAAEEVMSSTHFFSYSDGSSYQRPTMM